MSKKGGRTQKKSTKSPKAEVGNSAPIDLQEKLAKIAALLGTQPHLKEGLGEIAGLVTDKLAEIETSQPQAKGKKPTVGKKAKKKRGSACYNFKKHKIKHSKIELERGVVHQLSPHIRQ